MSDLPQELKRIRAEAVDFFVRVSAMDLRDGDLWGALTPSDRQCSEDILGEIGQVARRIQAVFEHEPLLGEDAIRTLRFSVRVMDAALRFRRLDVWDTHTEWDEDILRAVVPAGECENLVSASSAQSIFEEAIDRVLRLLRVAEPEPHKPPVADESESALGPEREPVSPPGRKGRKRGPPTGFKAAVRVAEIVARVASDRDWRLTPDEIGEALDHGLCDAPDWSACDSPDHEKIPLPRGWKKKGADWLNPPDRATLVKAIVYRLKLAEQLEKATPETLS